ncbi:MAG: ABC transporter permease [Candidatus Cloacimonadaceae bacterium]|nr:ABC transporter permease [Candidatus Cloacimonadaceae bacterium]MDP3114338.1 ABC transporter permease [Candidatus Cloacimonadaceae bacterium]
MDITYLGLLFASLLLFIPAFIFWHLKVPLIRTMLISFVRMAVQLAVIGLVLQFIFQKMNLALTLAWMLIMISSAVWTVRGRLKLDKKLILPILITALGTTSLTVMPWIIFLTLRPAPLYSPIYLIPIYGMVLGNSMNSCALALERFESGLADNWKAYYTRIILGANLREATLPAFKKALQTSLMPQLLTVASIGIVSLPGMMTGQILGGASPLVAIKYQLMIMISIFTGVSLTDFIAIRLYLKGRFDRFALPKGI